VAAVALVGAVALLLTLPFVSEVHADGYKALYVGRWIAQHGIPHREALTIAAHGRPWIDEQWLAELIYYQSWSLGGYKLLAVFAASLVALACMLIAAVMRRRGASVVTVICCATVASVTLVGSQFIRAQNFALPLFALLLALCLADAEHDLPRRRLILLLPLLVLWANLHGSVLLGAALAVAYLIYRGTMMARRRLWSTAAACAGLALAAALSPMATPYGFHILDYYREFIGNPAMAAATNEWQAPAYPSLGFFELYVPLVVVGALVLRSLIIRRPASALLVGAVGITAVAASRQTGSVVWFGMTAALLLAETASTRRPARQEARGFVALTTASAVALGAIVIGLLVSRSNDQFEGAVSVRAITATASYASSHPCARILADNWHSSALLWHDPWLAGRVAFDARLEQYPQQALADWVDFEVGTASRWSHATSGYQLLVGDATFTPQLAERLPRLPGASVLAQDSRGVAVLNTKAAGMGQSRCTPAAT
jgi:hypothetical protein